MASSSEMTARANWRFWAAVRPRRRSALRKAVPREGVGAAEGQVFAREAAEGDGDVVGAGVHVQVQREGPLGHVAPQRPAPGASSTRAVPRSGSGSRRRSGSKRACLKPLPGIARRVPAGRRANEEGADHRDHRAGRQLSRGALAREGLRSPRRDSPVFVVQYRSPTTWARRAMCG